MSLSGQDIQKEFITAANWAPRLAMEDATPVPADYDGDGAADLASRVNSGPLKGRLLIDYYKKGEWFKQEGWDFISSTAIYGSVKDTALAADFDGDGKADIAVFFKASKTCRIDYAKNGFKKWDATYTYPSLKNANEVSVIVANFDGDKKADISFKIEDGRWMIDFSNNKLGKTDKTITGCGDLQQVPAPADYDGDGKTDISVKDNNGIWKIDLSQNGFDTWDITIKDCGDNTAMPVPADYNGDDKADISIKTTAGAWKVAFSFENNTAAQWLPRTLGTPYGGVDAVPMPADYNGDGKADLGFVMKNDGRWMIDNFFYATNGYDWVSFAGKVANDFDDKKLNPRDVAAYSKLKKAFFNLVTDAPLSTLNYDNQKKYYMALIDKVGLQTMITDPHIYKFGDTATGSGFEKEKFIEQYTTFALAKYKKRIYAINLGDEPSMSAEIGKTKIAPLERVQKWTAYFERSYPGLPTFNNLLPLYGFASAKDYITYLQRYKQSSNSPFISFDHYPFRKSGMLLGSYFLNLSILKAEFPGRALWSTVWSALDRGGDIYNSTEKLMRFMAFCPVAYGAKGIAYFPYDTAYNKRDFGSAINSDMAKYNAAKSINLFLKNIVSPVVIHYRNTATLHSGNTYGYKAPANEQLASYQGIIKAVSSEHILIGVYENAEDHAKEHATYLWIMNKDTSSIGDITVTLRGNFNGKVAISPRAVGYAKSSQLLYRQPVQLRYNIADDETTFILPAIAASDALMVKIRL